MKKIKPSIQKKFYPITEIIYLLTEKDLKISSVFAKKITLMKKNFINSFQASNIWRKKF